MKLRILTLLFLLVVGLSMAQQLEIQIHTIEAATNKPLPWCHVCIRDIITDKTDYLLTDDHGKARFSFSGQAIISISFVGFETIIDTLRTQKELVEYKMKTQTMQFNEVVVTGQNKPVSVDKSIYNIQLIGSKQIENSASTSLNQLLNNQANIQINNDPSTGSSLKLGGITGENIKILVDDVPVIGRLDGNIDLSQINLSEVDHIEIVEGPMSVVYGSNALGGVINIITKENRYATFKAGADLFYESVGVYNANGNLSWKKKKNTLSANFGRNFFDGFSLKPDSREMNWKPKEQYNAGLNYVYSSTKMKLKAKVDGFKEKLLNRNEPYYIYGNDIWFYTNRLNASLHGDYQLSELNSIKTMFSYSYYDRIKQTYFKNLSTLESVLSPIINDHDTSVFNTIVARGTYNRHTKSEVLEYQMGFDINYEDAKGKRILNKYESIADYAAFLILKWNITDNLMFQPAIRAAINTKYNAPLVPSLNLKYQWERNSIRFSYARGFRAPSLKELYLYFYDTNHQIEGNADLKAERSHNFNLAYSGHVLIQSRPYNYRLTLYYNQISERISLIQVNVENKILYRNANIDKFESLGGVYNFTIRPLHHVELELSYAVTGTKTYSSGLNDFYFNHDASANLMLHFMDNTAHLFLLYKYFGKYPNPIYLEDNSIGMVYMDAYHNLDLNVSRQLFKNTLVIGAGVKNIFDNVQLNSVAGGGSAHGVPGGTSSLVGWGRTFFVSLKYNFTKY